MPLKYAARLSGKAMFVIAFCAIELEQTGQPLKWAFIALAAAVLDWVVLKALSGIELLEGLAGDIGWRGQHELSGVGTAIIVISGLIALTGAVLGALIMITVAPLGAAPIAITMAVSGGIICIPLYQESWGAANLV